MSSKKSANEIREEDASMYRLIRDIFECDNTYINRCKASREAESSQIMKLGNSCDPETSQQQQQPTPKYNNYEHTTTRSLPSTTTTTTTRMRTMPMTTSRSTTTNRNNNNNNYFDYYTRSSVAYPTTTTSTTTTTTTTPTTTTTMSRGREENEDEDCEDQDEKCASWAAKGECQRNRQFMNIECKKSCDFCYLDRTTKFVLRPTTTAKIDLSCLFSFLTIPFIILINIYLIIKIFFKSM